MRVNENIINKSYKKIMNSFNNIKNSFGKLELQLKDTLKLNKIRILILRV